MSKFGDELIESMKQAVAHAEGKDAGTRVTVVQVPNVRAIREKLHMSQQEFAKAYRIPLATVQGWEQNRRRPDATAAAYLNVIAKLPTETRNAFSS